MTKNLALQQEYRLSGSSQLLQIPLAWYRIKAWTTWDRKQHLVWKTSTYFQAKRSPLSDPPDMMEPEKNWKRKARSSMVDKRCQKPKLCGVFHSKNYICEIPQAGGLKNSNTKGRAQKGEKQSLAIIHCPHDSDWHLSLRTWIFYEGPVLHDCGMHYVDICSDGKVSIKNRTWSMQ